jgi:type II secretory pathway pseudopilin PulG
MANRSVSNRRRQPGFSYVEILLSVVLLAVLLVPALEALQSGIAGGRSSSLAAKQLMVRDKMERALAKPFADLYSETYLPGGNTMASVSASLSDPAGAPDRRNVVLYRYDATTRALSENDTGLVFVSVYYEAEGSAHALNTLVGGWW